MQRTAAARIPGGAATRATLSALCASLVGIGLSRFAYAPLIPALIAAQWFTPSQAAYLGAANLAGYLAGALLGRPLAARWRTTAALRAMMLLAALSFFACAAPVSFLWFFVWRFAAGLAGGVLMVLAAPTVLPHVPVSRRGLAGGTIFAGVGLGIAASGTLVPVLLKGGLGWTWIGLGMLALVLTALAWGGWPGEAAVRRAPAAAPAVHPGPALRVLWVEYGLNAAGLVPHIVFLVDFVARGLGRGLEAGAWIWVVYGVGAVFGPLLAGPVADRTGFKAALRFGLAIQAAAVALLAVSDATWALAVSGFVVGAFTPGCGLLALGRIHELAPHDDGTARAAWSRATVAFAVMQAAAAYALSFLFAGTGDYALLFALGAGALVLALLLDVLNPYARPNSLSGDESCRSKPL